MTNPQERGRAFEAVFDDLFALDGMSVREAANYARADSAAAALGLDAEADGGHRQTRLRR
jgi:hypothetical protein